MTDNDSQQKGPLQIFSKANPSKQMNPKANYFQNIVICS